MEVSRLTRSTPYEVLRRPFFETMLEQSSRQYRSAHSRRRNKKWTFLYRTNSTRISHVSGSSLSERSSFSRTDQLRSLIRSKIPSLTSHQANEQENWAILACLTHRSWRTQGSYVVTNIIFTPLFHFYRKLHTCCSPHEDPRGGHDDDDGPHWLPLVVSA